MTKAARTPGRSLLWVQGAAAGGVVVALPGLALTLGVLLCPAVVCYVSEKTPGHPVTRAMALCGSTAVFPPLHTLWEHGGGLDTALDLLADPSRPLLAWIACAAGWLLCETALIAGRIASQTRIRRQTTLLEREQTELTAEWTIQGHSEDP